MYINEEHTIIRNIRIAEPFRKVQASIAYDETEFMTQMHLKEQELEATAASSKKGKDKSSKGKGKSSFQFLFRILIVQLLQIKKAKVKVVKAAKRAAKKAAKAAKKARKAKKLSNYPIHRYGLTSIQSSIILHSPRLFACLLNFYIGHL